MGEAVGLAPGIMVSRMAACLSRAGHDVTVWNRTRAKADARGAGTLFADMSTIAPADARRIGAAVRTRSSTRPSPAPLRRPRRAR
jgi:3-hydroxyisobutyrate dehydrogenase-like beta-hydroxyacid dehydrogenase